MFNKTKQKKQGFSLMEMIIAVALFAFLMLSATKIFQMIIESQRNAISAQTLQENMRYAFEVMAKEIRMASLCNTDCNDIVTDEDNGAGFALNATQYKVYNITDNGAADPDDVLYFKNKDGQCVLYYLDNERLKIYRGPDAIIGGETFNDYVAFITPDEIKVTDLKFIGLDDEVDAFHSLQPNVTMVVDVKVDKFGQRYEQAMKIQTTISSRYYE